MRNRREWRKELKRREHGGNGRENGRIGRKQRMGGIEEKRKWERMK